MNKKKLRYAILKELDNGNDNISEETFGITPEEFKKQVEFLYREGCLTKPFIADDIVYYIDSSYLTEKGENYVKENSKLLKVYKATKEIKDWIRW